MPEGLRQGQLGPVSDPGNQNTILFVLNPTEITRERVPQYAQVQTSLADYTSIYPSTAPAPIEWVRNPPERISFDLLLVTGRDLRAQGIIVPFPSEDVEYELNRLDRMMAKDTRSRQPPDLMFRFGNRVDRVRITNKRVTEQLFSPSLKVTRATVHLEMLTIRVGK